MKIFKKFIKINLFLILCAIIVIIGLYSYAYLTPASKMDSIGKIFYYDNKEELIEVGNGYDKIVNLENISQDLINAVISVEDKNFYKHQGFDYFRIMKAMFLNVKNKGIVQGASTISQQYIKNIYLDFDQTWERKIEEAFLTLELEVHYDKDFILEGYLNTINYGQGNYGIEAAANYYFNKSSSDLNLEESIILAGIPKNPSNFNPVSNYDNCIKRAKTVALSMLNNEYITKDQYDSLFQTEIRIHPQEEDKKSTLLMYYRDAVFDELKGLKEVPNSLIESGGLKVYTVLDMEAQLTLEENITNEISDKDIQAASVIVNPNTGGIISLVGGTDYNKSQYNRAMYSKRQVGSTIKPFLYYAALENGFTSSSSFLSEETTFNFGSNNTYSPANYNNVYAHKNISMAAAIAYSDNIYAVKTHLFLGEETLIDIAHTCGITEELDANPSLALGTSELNMIDFATGYTTFASNGYNKELYLIEKVEDLEGNILYEHKDKSKLVLNQNNLYILNELLTNTTNSSFNDYTTPTALSIANKMSHKYALKTGTTKTDYWTVGYNNDVLMLVWMGYDEGKEIDSNVSAEVKNIWVKTVENVLTGKNDNWYEKPKNVIASIKDPITGDNTTNKNKQTLYYYVKGSNIDSNAINVSKEEE